eukprot:Phypoly_transcript_14198.p1 GENE.Phypoly_transcript_14198~~Phypoly_transcript_14198.p1  ORF type:complete len:264 (+),score=46.18 Phypoly_transcript_14198:52-843(+)
MKLVARARHPRLLSPQCASLSSSPFYNHGFKRAFSSISPSSSHTSPLSSSPSFPSPFLLFKKAGILAMRHATMNSSRNFTRNYATHKDLAPVTNNNPTARNSTRNYATHKDLAPVTNNNPTAVARTVAKAAVRTTYTAAGFLSIGIASILLYFLFDLMFNPTSENKVFQKCVEIINDNEQIAKTFGEPIHTYGYSVRSHPFVYTKYTNKNGNVCVKVEFDIEGPKTKGVVQAEIEQIGILNTKIVYMVVRVPGMWKKDIHVVK